MQARAQVIEEVKQGIEFWGSHMDDVANVSKSIAVALGLPPPLVGSIYMGGLVHDMGKSMAEMQPALMHPGKLNASQLQLVRQHTIFGVDVVKLIFGTTDRIVLDIVLSHHEKLDGSGYPYGLRDSQISLPVRISTVADIGCAMTRARPTGLARPREFAASALWREADKGELDRSVVKALVADVWGLPCNTPP
jgi:HD-GYP domain-containing protein (c-di-GMP phosphodiesterase class II)